MKKCIKNLAAATVVAGALMATQSAFAQLAFVQNDLYVGFENAAGGGSADYVVNVGPASSLVGKSSVIDLSADFSLASFTSAALKGSNPNAIVGGVVGASNAGNPSDVYATVVRTGNIGIPSISGSAKPAGISRSQDSQSEASLSAMIAPAAGNGILDTTRTWESDVEPAFNSGSFYGNSGVNPDSSVTTGQVAYEDLWFSSSSGLTGTQPFVYEGYFKFDFTGASAKVSFIPSGSADQLAAPTIQSISVANNTVTVVSTAIPTFHYQLQATASLTPTNWVNVGSSVVAISTLVTNTYSPETAPVKFYQISAH